MSASEDQRKAIIVSISSDIGTKMAQRWLKRGWEVFGTYRTFSNIPATLTMDGVQFCHCDFSEPASVKNACKEIQEKIDCWDVLVLCPATQDPIGPFETCSFDEWEASITVNFTSQLRMVHDLLPCRNMNSALEPCVLFFAGGGTNNAVVNYSAYTISKIALIKMCELLDAEIKDTRFVIVGPGWVKTKIHDATLKAGKRSGDLYQRTIDKLESNEFTPIEDVLSCCDWIIDAPRNAVSGRNFSVVFDAWGTQALLERLAGDENMYKLRRYGNDLIVRGRTK